MKNEWKTQSRRRLLNTVVLSKFLREDVKVNVIRAHIFDSICSFGVVFVLRAYASVERNCVNEQKSNQIKEKNFNNLRQK